MILAWALLSLSAATIFMALVICCVELTELILSFTSFKLAIGQPQQLSNLLIGRENFLFCVLRRYLVSGFFQEFSSLIQIRFSDSGKCLRVVGGQQGIIFLFKFPGIFNRYGIHQTSGRGIDDGNL